LVVVALLGAAAIAYALERPAEQRWEWGELVARCQDLRRDYLEAMEGGPEDVRATLELHDEAIELARGLGPDNDRTLHRLAKLRALIARRAAPVDLEPEWKSLIAELIRERKLRTSPGAAPDLRVAALRYRESCAACHGIDGRADGEVARQLDPPPTSFFNSDEMNPLSPFQAYQAITYGNHGTAMPSFAAALSERERWSLALYVFTFRQPPCEAPIPKVGVSELAISTDSQLTARYRERGLACLRRLRFQ
jgi:high-affinity iron transporter